MKPIPLVAASCLLLLGAMFHGWGRAGGQDASPATAPAGENVRVVTYNIENWRWSFEAFRLRKRAATQPDWPAEFREMIQRESREDDEENWEVARVLLDDAVLPDILLVQEGCSQEDLNYFNTQFLGGHFETIHVLATNTERGQETAVLMRKGFKALEWRENYRDEPDPQQVNTEQTGRLFARGPAFVKVLSPGGAVFWVGTNHAKSKSGNSVEVTRWRNAEAVRTNQIINDLRKTGPAEVVFMGDMNDELGLQEFELEAGGSAVDLLVGSGDNALVLATRALAGQGRISFHGQRSKRHQSLIDQAILTPEAARHVTDVRIFTGPVADFASDHYPVVLELKF